MSCIFVKFLTWSWQRSLHTSPMLVSLMSTFDPSVYSPPGSSSSTFVFHLVIFFLIMPTSQFWVVSSGLLQVQGILVSSFYTYLKMGEKHGLIFFFFLYILFMNLMSLLPFGFSLTSHFFNNFLPMVNVWFGSLLFFFFKNMSVFLSHLVPKGSPLFLSFLLVPIELVSILIRPFSLCMRLMANMIAGHMILLLILKGILSISLFLSLPIWVVSFLFTFFEVFVCLIQAFVFVNLLYMYWIENSI